MPLFRYQALTSGGKTIKGVIDADSLLTAKDRLRRQQLLVTHVTPHEMAGQKNIQLTSKFLLIFTKELAQLLHAGLPLYESLLTIEEKYKRHKAHALLLDLCDHLKEGNALSTALKRYPKIFNQIYLSMVQVAEQTGNMAEVFSQLGRLIERQHQLKKQIISATAYPCLLGVFCIALTLGLLLFVIPTMKELFEGRSLHPMTQLVLAVSDWVNLYGNTILCSLIALVIFSIYAWKKVNGKRHLYHVFSKMPLINTLFLQSALVRLCRGLEMLLGAGVPLLEALKLVKTVVKNPSLEKSVEDAEKKIIRGVSLSDAFKEVSYVPALVIRLVAISEETGNMRGAFLSLSEIYEEEVEKHLSQLTTFLQPVLLITMGMIVP